MNVLFFILWHSQVKSLTNRTGATSSQRTNLFFFYFNSIPFWHVFQVNRRKCHSRLHIWREKNVSVPAIVCTGLSNLKWISVAMPGPFFSPQIQFRLSFAVWIWAKKRINWFTASATMWMATDTITPVSEHWTTSGCLFFFVCAHAHSQHRYTHIYDVINCHSILSIFFCVFSVHLVEVTIRGTVEKKTGMVMNITELKDHMDHAIMKPLDHKNLDKDVDFFRLTVTFRFTWVQIKYRSFTHGTFTFVIFAAKHNRKCCSIHLAEFEKTHVTPRTIVRGEDTRNG